MVLKYAKRMLMLLSICVALIFLLVHFAFQRPRHNGVVKNVIINNQKTDHNDHCVKGIQNVSVKTPQGNFVPKYNKYAIFKSYGTLTKGCKYVNDKIQCSDVRELGETMFRQSQLTLTRLLQVLDLICTKYSIKYWLTYGSLLGSYRHKGNIPWDSDADVAMLYMDYLVFQKIVRRELPDDMYFQDGSDEPKFAELKNVEAKIRDKKSCYGWCLREGYTFNDGLQVDIFVFREEKSNGKSTMLINDRGHGKFEYDIIFPTSKIMHDGIELAAPRKPQRVLEKLYGVYYMHPPEDQCPNGFIPIPWYSCDHIKSLSHEQRENILSETLLRKQ